MAEHKPVYSDAFTTAEFRVSFPTVFEPKAYKDGDEKYYSIQMLFTKGADMGAFKTAFNQIMSELGWDKTKVRLPLEDGDELYTEDPQKNAHLQGVIRVKAKSKNRPGLVDRLKRDINNPNEFYGGCFARAQLKAKSYVMGGQKGISLQLYNVQKLKDGEAFGYVAPKPQDVFDAVGEADDLDTGFNILD